MTDDTTDDTTLAQRVDQLEDRLDEALGYQNRVESLIQQFARGQISRRAFLASMATVGAGTWMLSGSARADPEWQNATGQSGTEQTPLLDLYAQKAYHQTIDTDRATINHGLVRGRSGEWIDAARFDGSDPDERLGNAVNSVSGGDVIMLENATYDSDRTFSTRLRLVGTGGFTFAGTDITANWTFDQNVVLEAVDVSGGSITLTGFSLIKNTANADVTITGDSCAAIQISSGSVTFNSGTSGGLVDSCVNTTVTDNGSNTVGDVA